jgi:glutamate-5-semialdehyde dehydrogenase
MENKDKELRAKCLEAKEASRRMVYLSTEIKNCALCQIADDLIKEAGSIIKANKADYKEAEASGMNKAMLDRLLLTQERIEAMAQDVLTIVSLPDPVGEMFDMRTMANGLIIGRKRVPLGVIGAVYESRPNVTIDISSLCLKAGNAVILRGGKEAFSSNSALANLVQKASIKAGVPEGAVQFIDNTDRSLVNQLLEMTDVIDLIIPRGGAGLIKFIKENARIPVVAGGVGVCHTYIDKAADIEKAVAIAYNAKVQRPTVCNALDSLLVHQDIAKRYLPLIAAEWSKAGIEIHADERSMDILKPVPSIRLLAATDEDWGKEFLSLKAAVKVVDSLDEALKHISDYGSGHSEAIVTEDYDAAMRFLNEVDAAAVYANASTRYTDGAQFGLGAELGISTQKMHARGPLGLREITSYKWIIFGSGQIRP